jgi:hypothetical protein
MFSWYNNNHNAVGFDRFANKQFEWQEQQPLSVYSMCIHRPKWHTITIQINTTISSYLSTVNKWSVCVCCTVSLLPKDIHIYVEYYQEKFILEVIETRRTC